jgi:hypothetical protein
VCRVESVGDRYTNAGIRPLDRTSRFPARRPSIIWCRNCHSFDPPRGCDHIAFTGGPKLLESCHYETPAEGFAVTSLGSGEILILVLKRRSWTVPQTV